MTGHPGPHGGPVGVETYLLAGWSVLSLVVNLVAFGFLVRSWGHGRVENYAWMIAVVIEVWHLLLNLLACVTLRVAGDDPFATSPGRLRRFSPGFNLLSSLVLLVVGFVGR